MICVRVTLEDQVLYIQAEDLPQYNKRGSVVRNTYFWALRSIADRSGFDRDWEYGAEVWLALSRMLMSFTESGYLGYRETTLEFPPDTPIPEVLRPVSTWGTAE